MSAMSAKILLAAGLTATAGGATWVAIHDSTPDPATTSRTPTVVPDRVDTPTQAIAPPAPRDEVAPDSRDRDTNRTRWATQRSRIQAALATGAPEAEAAPTPVGVPAGEGMSWHMVETHEEVAIDCEQSECEFDGLALGELATEVTGMVEGCKDFMPELDPSVSLRAHVIGAPGVGTIVERVDFSGDGVPEELQECLTESMYALDLRPTERNTDQSITVMLGGEMLDLEGLDAAGLDEQTRAAIEEAAAKGGQGKKMYMLHLGEGE